MHHKLASRLIWWGHILNWDLPFPISLIIKIPFLLIPELSPLVQFLTTIFKRQWFFHYLYRSNCRTQDICNVVPNTDSDSFSVATHILSLTIIFSACFHCSCVPIIFAKYMNVFQNLSFFFQKILFNFLPVAKPDLTCSELFQIKNVHLPLWIIMTMFLKIWYSVAFSDHFNVIHKLKLYEHSYNTALYSGNRRAAGHMNSQWLG